MSRERVSKGKIIQKKDEKVIKVLLTLKPEVSGDEFVSTFIKEFPSDWERVKKRYKEHERLTPKGKSHPMALPHQYLLNASKKIREQYANGKDLNELLIEFNTPKPKFVEETPKDIDKLMNKIQDLSSYEVRIEAVNKLGKFKCEKSILALTKCLSDDPVFDVRDTAYQRLIRFGCSINKPSKGQPYIDPEIQFKLQNVKSQLKDGFSQEKFTIKFKTMYPTEFDLQRYHQKNRFKHWLKSMIDNLPKT
ncbi:HEAT repeat domain-containing protein [Photobacterium aquimaris]|uniref:HEAT repeat domain-containing protein n=1 Tax=Photobacterium aquimaris TaxID=512643 RepID=A0A1Y6L4H4_9GAMM|nr:HEAT repeat domain-containing protein [Photobacterium aquimaris]SMY18456.1 hypothetical protein PAQU9191_03817 [Photobacterium aquimaris]